MFKYEPISLEGPAFRLLRLHKGDGDSIQCELFESTLPPPEHLRGYAAVSYTWGSQFKPCEIIINRSSVEITKNAYLTLRDLRYHDKDRILWIDTLCIMQNDIIERGQQVQQMGSIYNKAERVIIWLGEATYETDYIMRYIKRLEREREKRGTFNGLDREDKQLEQIWSSMIGKLNDAQRDLLIRGLQTLLHREWFKRVWVIQEVANARFCEVTCGSKTASATVFAQVPHLLKITPDLHCQHILSIMPGALRDQSWWAENPDLYTMLNKFRNSEATDARDRIYALLDISSDACNSELLKADYTKNIEEVIYDTISFLLEFNKLASPPPRFLSWGFAEFLRNLNSLANELLKCAMKEEHVELVNLLILRDDVNVNIKTNGKTPLLWAAENGHVRVTKLLLMKDRIKVNSVDNFGRTPLILAAKNGHTVVVKLLLRRDEVNLNSRDSIARTALSFAAENGHKVIVKLLLAKEKVGINLRDSLGRTPLLWAARQGHEAVVKLLLRECKIDTRTKDHDRQTPLALAAFMGHEGVVKLLLTKDEVHLNLRDSFGRTPLLWAVLQGYEAVVELLLKRDDIDVNSKDREGATPLSVAAWNGYEAVVKLLLFREEIDVNSRDDEGRTPLSRAIYRGHEAVVKLLRAKGAVP